MQKCSIIAKMLEEEVNSPLIGKVEKQLAEKRLNPLWQCNC